MLFVAFDLKQLKELKRALALLRKYIENNIILTAVPVLI